MRNCALIIILALGLSLIPATAQVSNVDAPSPNNHLADRIQKGDSVAVLEAGKTGDPSFIPQLLAYRKKSGKRKDFPEIAVQLALAKLGQLTELQQVRCELLFGSPSVRYDAVGKLEYLGGWFSLEAVTHVLDNLSTEGDTTVRDPSHRQDTTRRESFRRLFRTRRRSNPEYRSQVRLSIWGGSANGKSGSNRIKNRSVRFRRLAAVWKLRPRFARTS